MKSQKLLESFTAYCKMYPELRFWQALRNWCNYNFIYVGNEPGKILEDTFYWRDRK